MKKRFEVQIYVAGKRKWVGRFETKREANIARAKAMLEAERENAGIWSNYIKRFLADYQRQHKTSSYDTAKQGLSHFEKAFGEREIASISRLEARDWARDKPRQAVAIANTLVNAAIDDELLDRNPLRGLTPSTKGRSEALPPTHEEFASLLDSCAVHGAYGPQMRAIVSFAAYSGLRPGEIFALRWTDIDFDRHTIHVQRRLYNGELDLPKGNRTRLVALTPLARQALVSTPRTCEWVFTNKSGYRLSHPTFHGYWKQVLIRAGLDFDFYLATKHYCAHYLWIVLGNDKDDVRQQLGHVDTQLLERVYGHRDIGALDRIRASFDRTAPQLRAVPTADTTANEG